MLTCFTEATNQAIPVTSIPEKDFPRWLEEQKPETQQWLKNLGFTAKPDTYCWIPGGENKIQQVLLGVSAFSDFWSWGNLPLNLPHGIYEIHGLKNKADIIHAAMAWGLGSYQFTRYKKPKGKPSQLVLPADQHSVITHLVKAYYLVRDLINTPSENMGPAELAEAARLVGEPFGAEVKETIGDQLLVENYPTIHTVGRASTREPRLIDMRWGNTSSPRITVVGKGVCFDSGGLDIKTANGMGLMKKDMAGGAHALGLAYLIMAMNLPVSLRVLIPAVDNVISGNAYKPGDIITTRKGITVEVNNTDAEGRLVLSDALAEAASEKPELIIDFATLTGAARVALGPDIAALFGNNTELTSGLLKHAQQVQDPMLEFPLYKPYRKYIDSLVADISNSALIPYGGAMTAGLFLNEFVPSDIPWVHFDLMAWNISTQPGRPEGGEAMAIRAVWSFLKERFTQETDDI